MLKRKNKVKFAIGDIVEVHSHNFNGPKSFFGTITDVEHLVYMSGCSNYHIYINNSNRYYRSDDVIALYKKNKKGKVKRK